MPRTQPPKKTQPQPTGRRPGPGPIPIPQPGPAPAPPPTRRRPPLRDFNRFPSPYPGGTSRPKSPQFDTAGGYKAAPNPALSARRGSMAGRQYEGVPGAVTNPDWWVPPTYRDASGNRVPNTEGLSVQELKRRAGSLAGTPPSSAGMLAKKGGAVKPKLTKAQGAKASAKISHLHKTEPKMPHKQMVGMAMNMAREGRLGSKGGYTPKKATKRAKKR